MAERKKEKIGQETKHQSDDSKQFIWPGHMMGMARAVLLKMVVVCICICNKIA